MEQARDSVAVLLGTSHPDEFVFTNGGTQSRFTIRANAFALANEWPDSKKTRCGGD